jgi:LytR cell envelope-related transcriptional attenuator
LRPAEKILRAAAVLLTFLAAFWAVDRYLSAGTPARLPAAVLAPAGTAAPVTEVAPSSTRSNATTPTTAVTTTTKPPSGTQPAAGATSLAPVHDVTVQVLNGSWSAGAATNVAARLRRAGYDVVATQLALGEFPVSRLYYSEGHLADALGLQRRFPEFKQVEPAPQRLSRTVDLHAVVGRDYQP